MTDLLAIARRFCGASTALHPLGNGLINDTYRVEADPPFVLQRLNTHVFPAPEAVLENLAEIGRHLDRKPPGSLGLAIPRLLYNESGEASVRDVHGQVWRALSFIPDTLSLESPDSLDEAAQAGLALGRFHRLLSDLDPARLQDTLPGFHIAPAYLARYRAVSAGIEQGRNDPECAAFIGRCQSLAGDLEAAKHQGLLPLRIIHGDPKLNNFLFDAERRTVIGVVDLDTVKPGLLHYDIGDCLRSCCHRSSDDGFDAEIAAAMLEGYLAEAGHFFTEADYRYLYSAMRLIPFELGIRFYTDHLEGDRYFKVAEPGQNLRRAQAQFRLCASVIRQESALERLIASLRRPA